jgi:outer membrane usher protein
LSPATINSFCTSLIFWRLLLYSLGFLAVSTPAFAQDRSNQLPPAENQPALPSAVDQQPEKPTPAADNEDELFEKVFGHPRTQSSPQRILVPLIVNDQKQGEILVLVSPGNVPAVRFQAVPFFTQIAEILRPDIQEKLQTAVDKEGNLTLEVLRQNGLTATFDDRQLELQIQIPPAQRKTSVYNLQEQGLPPEAKNALRPSALSGYLNLRGGQDYIWAGQKGNAIGRQPFRLDLEGALNIKGWVLEGSGLFAEQAHPVWSRGDLRLVRDAPGQALRYVVGDLSIPIAGYQSSRPMVGVMVARNFSLQPYRVTRPISRFEFFLQTPSKVDVYINGLLTQTLQLPAGPQDIRDLPLSSGVNDVQLVITDAVGRVQRLSFPASVASDLLATGLEQFAYSLGFPSARETGSYNYQWDQPTLSLAYRRGLSNTLTMGAYLQGDPKQQLAGFEGAWATPYGNLGWDAALSHTGRVGSDYAFRLRYEYLKFDPNNSSQRILRLALEHRGPRFTTLDKLTFLNDFAWNFSASYNQSLLGGIQASIGADYQIGHAGVPDTYGASLGLSKSFSNGLGVSLTLNHRQDKSGNNEERALLNIFWLLPERRQSLLALTEVSNKESPTSQVTWNYSTLRTIGGFSSSVGVLLDPVTPGLTGQLDYTGYRFVASLSHDFNLPQTGDQTLESLTRLTFGTAIVFADGHFGWSRPVNESFALLLPNKNLRGQIIGIDPSVSGYTARADKLGPAVVIGLSPYYVSTLKIDAPKLPLGYDLGPTTYNLLPTYKSGTLIRVGTEATVFIRGVLLDASGKPVALQSGEVASLSDAKWPSITLFTNKAGKFALAGFKPGRYEIRLYTQPQGVVRFEIPSGKAGLYDLGSLKITAPIKSD